MRMLCWGGMRVWRAFGRRMVWATLTCYSVASSGSGGLVVFLVRVLACCDHGQHTRSCFEMGSITYLHLQRQLQQRHPSACHRLRLKHHRQHRLWQSPLQRHLLLQKHQLSLWLQPCQKHRLQQRRLNQRLWRWGRRLWHKPLSLSPRPPRAPCHRKGLRRLQAPQLRERHGALSPWARRQEGWREEQSPTLWQLLFG